MMDLFIKHSKKSMITLMAFVLLTTGVAITLFFIYGTNDIVATLGEKKVTRTEYEDAKRRCEGFYKYNSDEEAKKQCSESQIKDLIFLMALETEAEKRSVTVSEDEISKRYTELISIYKSEKEYKATIQDAYGWTTEDVKRNIKKDILKEKLRPSLISEKGVVGIHVRWDWAGEANSKEEENGKNISKKIIEENFYSPLKNGDNKAELSKKAEVFRTRADNVSQWGWETMIAAVDFQQLNAESSKNTFTGKEDWEAISQLKNKGDVTKIIVSSGGYSAAYRLESSNSAEFSSWEDFSNKAFENAKISLLSHQFIVLKDEITSSYKKAANKAASLIGLENVYAGCEVVDATCDCTNNHFGMIDGFIYDPNTGYRIPDASVAISAAASASFVQDIGKYPKCYNPQESGGFTVNSATGDFQLGAIHDTSQSALSCFTRWNVNITHPNYESISYIHRSLQGNGTAIHLDRQPERVGEDYVGEYRSQNFGNNDGSIALKLKLIPRGWHDQVDGSISGNDWTAVMNANDLTANGYNTATSSHSCEVTIGWACDPADYNYQSGIHLYATNVNTEWGAGLLNLSTSVAANIYRHGYGFETACGGNLNHGFVFQIPDSLKTGTDKYIWAYAFSKTGVPYKLTNTPQKINCSPSAQSNLCPSLTAEPTTVNAGDPVTLTWGGGNNVNMFDIKEQPSGGTLATVFENIQGVTGGSINVMPTVDTTYFLDVLYNGSATRVTCPSNGVSVTVNGDQSGTDTTVPPN